MDEWMTLREAAARVKLKPDTLRKLYLIPGKLPAQKLGRQWRIRTSDLDLIFHPPDLRDPLVKALDDATETAGICLHATMQDQWRTDVEQLQPAKPPPT